MSASLLTLVVLGAALALAIYLGRERLGWTGAGLAGLRTVAFAALALALLNPLSSRRVPGGEPTVLLDASLSMDAAGGRWQDAFDTASSRLGSGGVLWRFGSELTIADSASPTDGASRLTEALRAAVSRTGPIVVVTDGEIDDAVSIAPTLLRDAEVVTLVRDTLANAALLDVSVRPRAIEGDSVPVEVTIGMWGIDSRDSTTLDVFVGDRRLVSRVIDLPSEVGTVRRTVVIPARSLRAGTHVLRVVVQRSGDLEPRDDERLRLVTVVSQPPIVVVVDPADLEGRFLVKELSEVVPGGVRGYAHVTDSNWVEMSSLNRVEESVVRSSVNAASMVIVRGAWTGIPANKTVWRWPAAADATTEFFVGDWYVTPDVPASPFAARLASISWDSMPPLSGVVPLVATANQSVALTSRLGRRGGDRPVLVAEDSLGVRRLTTAATGLWRWALRGGAAREAYRTLVASGTDWLLASQQGQAAASVSVSSVVARGRPVRFEWTGTGSAPDSLPLRLTGPDSSVATDLRFGPTGEAFLRLPPGVYQWTIPGQAVASGVVAVETYSDEFHVRPVTIAGQSGSGGFGLIVRQAREQWWIFLVAIAALIGEWAWRQRRGLP